MSNNRGLSEEKGESVSSNLPDQNPDQNEVAIKKALEFFAQFDAQIAPSDKSKKNPYNFSIIDHIPSPEESAHLFIDSYLFVKENNKSWQWFYVTSEGLAPVIKPKSSKDLEQFLPLLNSEEFSSEVYKNIQNQISFYKLQDNKLKPLIELLETEKTFHQGLREFVRRMDGIANDLDEKLRHELKSYLEPYKGFSDITGEFQLPADSYSQDKKADAYKIITNKILDSALNANKAAFFRVLPDFEKFNEFLGQPLKWKGENTKMSIAAYADKKTQATLSSLSLQIMPVQRFPRYVMLMKEAVKYFPEIESFRSLQDALNARGEQLNFAQSKNSESAKQLRARQAVGLISRGIRILKSNGVTLEPGKMFDELFDYSQDDENFKNRREFNPKERARLKNHLLRFYMHQYLEGRYKGYIKTAKSDRLKAVEDFILGVEQALENTFIKVDGKVELGTGIEPILFKEAKEINAAGLDNREETIFAVASKLDLDSLKNLITDLYQQAQVGIRKDVENATDQEILEIKKRLINVFKVLEKIGGLAKPLWQEIVVSDKKYEALFKLSDEQLKGTISETRLEQVDKKTENFKQRLSVIVATQTQGKSLQEQADTVKSPRADESKEEKENEFSDDEHLPIQIEEIGLVAEDDIESKRNLKREIFSILSKHILTGLADASKFGYDQAQILRKLLNQVNSRILYDERIGRILADNNIPDEKWIDLQKRLVPEKVDPLQLVDFFRNYFLVAYIDAYALKGEDREALGVLRKMITNIDLELQELFPKSTPLLSKEKLATSSMNQAIFAAMAENKVYTEDEVNKLFNNLLSIINNRPTGNYERHAFENTITAITRMGNNAISQWNTRSDRDFYELSIDTSVSQADTKLLNSFDKVVKLATTEAKRRSDIIDVVCQHFIHAFRGKFPEKFPPKQQALAMEKIIKTKVGADTRQDFYYHLRTEMFSILMSAYISGRERSLGRSIAGPYLKEAVNFIKHVDRHLDSLGQEPMISAVSTYEANIGDKDAIEITNQVFANAPEVFKNKFPDFINSLFLNVKNAFDDMMKYMHDVKTVQDYSNRSDNNPFYMARLVLVNTLKAIERMSKINPMAKTIWNDFADPLVPSYETFGPLLHVNPQGIIHDTEVKDAFEKKYAIVLKVNEEFEEVKSLFDKMMSANANLPQGLILEKYTKKEGPTHAARKQLVDSLEEIQSLTKKDPYAKELWNQLAMQSKDQYGSFGELLLMPQKVSETDIKKEFVEIVKAIGKAPTLFQPRIVNASAVGANFKPSISEEEEKYQSSSSKPSSKKKGSF